MSPPPRSWITENQGQANQGRRRGWDSSSESDEKDRRRKKSTSIRKKKTRYISDSDESSDEYEISGDEQHNKSKIKRRKKHGFDEENSRRRRRSKKKIKRSSRKTRGGDTRKRRYTDSDESSSNISASGEERSHSKSKRPRKKLSGDDGSLKAKLEEKVKEPQLDQEESNKKALAPEDEEAAVVGPMPLPNKAQGHISNYHGRALRPGEGDAIAQYVQQGKRIPRRGEVGLNADEIQRFEDLGYVMSGSRHQRMNAIRIRKENQVYSAEDKRALAMFNYEEKAKHEAKVMSDLSRLVQRHMGQELGPNHDPFGSGKTDGGADD